MKEKENKEIQIKQCSQACIDNEVACHIKECEFWIKYENDNNCDLISIKKHGQLTLREVGERLGVSYVRIKQIEDAAIKKIKKNVKLDPIHTN